MRTLLGIALSIFAACTGTRTGNPGVTDDPPPGVIVAKSKIARETSPSVTAADAEKFGSDNRAFALALYEELAKEPGNLFFSPYSISTALAMTYAGAKGNTASEMASAMRFTLGQDRLHAAFNATDRELASRENASGDPMSGSGGGFQLSIVNQAWGQQGYTFLDSYLDVLALNYGAGLFLLDFADADASRKTINDWVADQTEDRIEDLLPTGAIGRDTTLVLTNAIYFKASWLRKFDAALTAPAPFMAEAGTRSVPTMQRIGPGGYAESGGYQAVSLPYLSHDVKMLLILPPAGALSQHALDVGQLDALREGLDEAYLTVHLPKWTFESSRTLKGPLQALGMNDAFMSGVADLTGMDGMPGSLSISEVYHKAFVAVDEEGTEAAAATAVVIDRTSASEPVTVRFDRPFMFMIYDDPTGQILFFGHVADPS